MHINKLLVAITIILLAAFLSACAFGHYGQANTGYFDIELPHVAQNAAKPEIIRTFGIPDSKVSFEGTEYWRYRNKSGWFILLGGTTKEKDLIIEFKEEKVSASYLIDKGSSIGILMLQGAVSN